MPNPNPHRKPEPLSSPPDPGIDEPQPPNPIVDQADDDDEPAVDEIQLIDKDEFGEPIDESETDDDADDWDKSEI